MIRTDKRFDFLLKVIRVYFFQHPFTFLLLGGSLVGPDCEILFLVRIKLIDDHVVFVH